MILCIFSSSNLFFYFNFSHHRTRSKKGGVRQQTLLCHHSNACKSTLKCLVSSIKKDNKLSRNQHGIVFFSFLFRGDTSYHGTTPYKEVWPSPYTFAVVIILPTCLYYVFVWIHQDKQHYPSCRHWGSNRWPLDYKASALPLHHGGPTRFYILPCLFSLVPFDCK